MPDRTDRWLWLPIFLGLMAAGLNTIVGYTATHWVCDVNHKTVGYVVNAIDLLLCAASIALALSLRQRLYSASDASLHLDRQRFMANAGLLLSVFSLLVVIGGTIAVLVLAPCD
jgi:hypothetical protein